MTESEKEYLNKINQTLSELQKINEGFSLTINKHGGTIEEIAKVMLPTINDVKGKDLPAQTAESIIGAYQDLLEMYTDQNTQVTLLLGKQLETTKGLIEFLSTKLRELN